MVGISKNTTLYPVLKTHGMTYIKDLSKSMGLSQNIYKAYRNNEYDYALPPSAVFHLIENLKWSYDETFTLLWELSNRKLPLVCPISRPHLISGNFRDLMTSHGHESYSSLARLLGVEKSTFSRWFSKKTGKLKYWQYYRLFEDGWEYFDILRLLAEITPWQPNLILLYYKCSHLKTNSNG